LEIVTVGPEALMSNRPLTKLAPLNLVASTGGVNPCHRNAVVYVAGTPRGIRLVLRELYQVTLFH
jgi:hypothetical protein